MRPHPPTLLTLAATLGLACQSADPPGPESGPPEEAPAVLHAGREIRLPSADDAARFGFRAEGSGFAAGHATHEVRIAAGVLEVTPRHLGQTGAVIRLETTGALRGDHPIDLALVASAVEAESGALEVRRAALSERFANFEGGVEQSWRFERQPGSAGDLVVEIAVRGQDYLAATDRGLHFAAAGGLGVRYSHAVWVAADGKETDIPARYEGGAIRLVVPDAVVAESAYPAVLDPVIEPEVRVDRPVLGGTGVTSNGVAVARSASGYLAVWRQQPTDFAQDARVRAARIATDGTVLDKEGITVFGQNAEHASAAAFAGDYLVVYERSSEVYLRRVGQDGSVERIGTINPADGTYWNPDIAAGSGEAMIVYNDRTGSLQGVIRAVRYDGTSFGAPVTLGSASSFARPRIALQPGGDYLVVWTNPTMDLAGRFVSPAGAAGTSVTLSTAPADAQSIDVAFAGSSFAVVWAQTGTGGEQVRGFPVSPSGVVGTPVAISALTFAASDPSITCDASCLVLWSGGPDSRNVDLLARRLDGDLVPLGDEVIARGGQELQGPAEAAGAAGTYYLVWADELSGIEEAYGAPASDDGSGIAVGTPTLLATGDNTESLPAVELATNSWLVAWSDSRNGGADIFGKRFGLDGVEKSFAAKPIHEGPGIEDEVSLGWNGSRYLAAWRDPGIPAAVRATRIEANGTVVDPGGITIGTAGASRKPDVVGGSDGGWLVGWTRDFNQLPRAQAVVVHADGTRSPLMVLADNAGDVAVGWDPDAGVYVAAWYDRQAFQLRARRIAVDGTPIDSAPVTLAAVPAGDRMQMSYGGGSFLLLTGANQNRLNGTRMRITSTGIEALGVVPLLDGWFVGTTAITFTARGHIVLFTANTTASDTDIYGLQVSTGGLVQGAPFLVAGGPDHQDHPAIAGASQGRAFLVYERKINSSTSATKPRLYARRLVAASPNGTSCSSGSQCESGFCTDGRCCDEACGGGAIDCLACSVKAGGAIDGICSVAANHTICRRSADSFCDLGETCDGVASTCPPDEGRREGEVCDADCGAVCPLADESGSPHLCPTCP